MSYEHRETMRMGIDRALYDIEQTVDRLEIALRHVPLEWMQHHRLAKGVAALKCMLVKHEEAA